MQRLDFGTSLVASKRGVFFSRSFLVLFLFLVILINPRTVLAYTYSDVESFFASHPSPSGCMNWIEEAAGGYRVVRRCNGAMWRSMTYEFYADALFYNTDPNRWSGDVIACGTWNPYGGGPYRTYTNNFYGYYTRVVHRMVWCDGSIGDIIEYPSSGYIAELGTKDPCVDPPQYYGNCKNLDSVLAQ
ncbi:MAG: hypothetical protein HY883_08075, partial [Deltaproteobacteria bacterium]|nr:hypothetical protein [Deltaproteobacteria bacterium]